MRMMGREKRRSTLKWRNVGHWGGGHCITVRHVQESPASVLCPVLNSTTPDWSTKLQNWKHKVSLQSNTKTCIHLYSKYVRALLNSKLVCTTALSTIKGFLFCVWRHDLLTFMCFFQVNSTDFLRGSSVSPEFFSPQPPDLLTWEAVLCRDPGQRLNNCRVNCWCPHLHYFSDLNVPFLWLSV